MTSFDDCNRVEERGRDILLDHLSHLAERYVVTDKGRLARDLQRTVGDALCNTHNGAIWAIEFKVEQRYTGNLFLETWSNLKVPGYNKPGWLVTLNTDILWYYFLDNGQLISLPFQRLKHWALVQGNVYRWPEKLQRKHEQRNHTYGRIVPISILLDALDGFHCYRRDGEVFTELGVGSVA